MVLIDDTLSYYGCQHVDNFTYCPSPLRWVHGFATPLFFENNKKILLNGKLRHLDLITLGLQTCHGNSQNEKTSPTLKI
jgi:hypothetical protein